MKKFKYKLKLIKSDNRGFTMIEILMVVLLVGILAAVGTTQFINFSKDTKTAAVKSDLQVLRNGISSIFALTQLRCSNTSGTWPPVTAVTANDITTANADSGGSCATATITNTNDRMFVRGGIPGNPWGAAQSATVASCVAGGGTGSNPGPAAGSCIQGSLGCAGGAFGDGWCYDPTSGKIWANSNNLPGESCY